MSDRVYKVERNADVVNACGVVGGWMSPCVGGAGVNGESGGGSKVMCLK